MISSIEFVFTAQVDTKIMSRAADYLQIIIQNRLNNYPPPLTLSSLRVFHIGGYWRGPKDIVAQMFQGLETICSNVFEFNTDENRNALCTENRPYDRGTNGPVWIQKEKVFPLILKFRPHLVICNAGGLSFRPNNTIILRGLGIKLLGIALSDPAVYPLTTSRIAKNFDAFFTNDIKSVELYQDAGIRAYQLPLATNDQLFHPVSCKPDYQCDVLHLGSAQESRVEPIKLLKKHFDIHVHGENWENYGVENRGIIIGNDLLSVLSSANIVVVLSRAPSGYHIIKPQIFDYLSAGCLVVTDDFPELHRYFDVAKELVTFIDSEDMIMKIRYYLDNPNEASKIREAGREKVIKNYTWPKIWPELLSLVFQRTLQ